MRTEKIQSMMKVAIELSKLSTCKRRNVGCVLVDSRHHIIGTGYNGVPNRFPHCTDQPCAYSYNEHGSTCLATHAETNAIAQCHNIQYIEYVFTTSFPCFECAKLIANTGASFVFFNDDYPSSKQAVIDLFNFKGIAFIATGPLHESA